MTKQEQAPSLVGGAETGLNPTLTALRRGEPVFGLIGRVLRSPEIAWIAKGTGHDFVFLDLQNGPFSPEAVTDICSAGLGIGLPIYVRVPSCDYPDLEKLLNLGATGAIIADVKTAKDAELAVSRCRFGPNGQRGVTGSFPHYGYVPKSLGDAKTELNGSTLVAVMIESREGLANVAEIAAVPGVDVIHMGANDLLSDLGSPGAFDGLLMKDLTAQVIEASRNAGKFAGVGGDKDPERQLSYITMGAQFITTHSDLAYLMAAAKARTDMLRARTLRK